MLTLANVVSLACLLATASAKNVPRGPAPAPSAVCQEIAKSISSASSVYLPGTAEYANDNFHTYGTSSQVSTCSVEPGTAKDVGAILKIVGKYKTPFAVKGGGHAYNQNYSSTTGVQISMNRFNGIKYNAKSQTAKIGSGLKWNAVYRALDAYNVTAVGGRVPDVGVAGFLLGGGYSWHTNQHGLGVDNIVAYELVKPNGDVVTVSKTSNSDLMFALKGGYNNFGIVTEFTVKTPTQGQVWGGLLYHTGDHAEEANAAFVQFLKNNDPKAGLLFSQAYTQGMFLTVTQMFYDGPTPPAGIFDAFLAIPGPIVNTVNTSSFADLVDGLATPNPERAMHGTVPTLDYDKAWLEVMQNETVFWGAELARLDPNITVAYVSEPFLSSFLSHGDGPTAYPASRAQALLPTTFEWAYTNPAADAAVRAAMIATQDRLQSVSNVNLADADVVMYGNYALAPETPVEKVFGGSLPRLRELKKKYDPKGVMNLTGGWKV